MNNRLETSNWGVGATGTVKPPPVPVEAQLDQDIDELWREDDVVVDETLDLRFDEFMGGDVSDASRAERSFLA